MRRKDFDFANGLAGIVVGICLFGGLAIQYPGPAKLIGVTMLITWGVRKFIDWKWG